MFSVIAVLAAFGAVRGFRFDLTGKGLDLSNTLSFTWLLLFLFFAWTLIRSKREPDRGVKLSAAAFSLLIAVFYSAGLSFEKMKGLGWIWSSRGNLINYLNLFFSVFILYYCCSFHAFRMLRDHPGQTGSGLGSGFSFKKVLLFWVLLQIFYIPWYLYCYPGVLTYDSGRQVRDALSVDTLDNHHSALLDLVIRGILLPVKNLTGSVQIGIGLCTLGQMLIMTFLFAAALEKIFRHTQNRILQVLVFLWFAAYPVNNIYSVTMWKDILFAGCVLALMLLLDAASDDEHAFFRSRYRCVFLGMTLLLLPLLRHNGILISVGMTIYLFFAFKDFRRQVMILCAGWICLFILWNRVLLPAWHVKPISSSEVLSVPLQQIARAIYNHHGELHPNLVAEAESYFTVPEIWYEYEPLLSDPVKSSFRASLYEEDPARFFRLWADLGKRYPFDYLEAFLHNNYGYWFPETTYWISSYGVLTGGQIRDLHTAPILKIGIIDRIYNWYAYHQEEKTPLLPLLFSRGACFWVWLFCGIWCLYRNRRKFILFMPGLFLWGSILISPVYNEYRYVYGLFICLPLFLVSALFSKKTGIRLDGRMKVTD